MAQPRALQDALKKSEELIEAQKDTEETVDQADPDQYLKMVEAEEETEAKVDDSAEESNKPEAKPKANETLDDEALTQLQAEKARIENQYRVLKGKYDAEVPRLSDEIRALKSQLEQIATQEPAKPDPDVEAIKSKLADTFTEDEVEALDGLIRHHANSRKTDDSEIRAMREQLQQVTHQTRESQLGALVPDWQQINQSDEFIAYLKEVDPKSGAENNDYLQQAWQVGDIPRVAVIFNDFKQRLSKTPEPPPPEPTTRASTPNTQAGSRKVWRQSEINEIAKLYQNGRFKGREAEYKALRNQIELAAAEGRVDPNR